LRNKLLRIEAKKRRDNQPGGRKHKYTPRGLTNRDKEAKCLTCSNVADACTPEDGPCDDEPENNVDSSFLTHSTDGKEQTERK